MEKYNAEASFNIATNTLDIAMAAGSFAAELVPADCRQPQCAAQPGAERETRLWSSIGFAYKCSRTP